MMTLRSADSIASMRMDRWIYASGGIQLQYLRFEPAKNHAQAWA